MILLPVVARWSVSGGDEGVTSPTLVASGAALTGRQCEVVATTEEFVVVWQANGGDAVAESG